MAEKVERIFYKLIISSYSLYTLILILRQPMISIITLLEDDAFYYFQVARNIVAGFGSTFDQLNLTNGYHPLWQVLILPIFALFKDLNTPVYCIIILQVLLLLAAAWLVGDRLLKHRRYFAAALLAALVLANLRFSVLNGLESPLLLFLAALFFCWLDDWGNFDITKLKTSQLWLGSLLLGLIFLCRLDMGALFALAFAIIVIAQQIRLKQMRQLFTFKRLMALLLPFFCAFFQLPCFQPGGVWSCHIHQFCHQNLISAHQPQFFANVFTLVNRL